MSKKKKKQKKKQARSQADFAQGLEAGDVDPARVAAYARLMEVETVLYQLWEERTKGSMDWVGEVLRDVVDEETTLWLAAMGDKVAALGGHLELIAVFADRTVTLLREPGIYAGEESSEPG